MNKIIIIIILTLLNGFYSFSQITKEVYLEGAERDYNNGYLITGLEKVNKALELDSFYSDAYYIRAKIYIKGAYTDYYEPAIQDCEKCIKLDSVKNYWEAYYYLASRFYNEDLIYMTYYDKAVSFNPRNIDLLLSRGWAKNWREDYDGALEDYNMALSIDNKNIKTLLRLGNFHITKDNKRAIYYFRLAKKVDKNNPNIYLGLGHSYYWLSKSGKNYNYCKYYKHAKELGYEGYHINMSKCGIKDNE